MDDQATAPPVREPPRIVTRVIEARFDDLTGAEPSFRLVGPAGVLEARRPDEVPGVLAAAEQAAARGLWVAGFVAYEAAPGLDPRSRVRARPPADPFADLPLAWFAMFEGREETVPAEPERGRSNGRAGRRPGHGVAAVDDARRDYDAAIGRIHRAIAAGDTYQVNLTLPAAGAGRRRPQGPVSRSLLRAARRLRRLPRHGDAFRILSASPELFFRIDGGRIVTKPMKGTAPRGRWLAEDEAIRAGLEGSVKDRAENAMIVDLLRNDLGRVARRGPSRGRDVFAAERFETVWQLTSAVGARPASRGGARRRLLAPCSPAAR